MKTTHFASLFYKAPKDSRLKGAEFVSPVENVSEQSVIADFWPCDEDGITLDGHLYGVPLATSTVTRIPAGEINP